MNRVLIRSFIGKTPFEPLFGKTPTFSYFKVFDCKCFILNTHENLEKFDKKSDKGIFLVYASNKKAYKVYNKWSLVS